MDTEQKVWGETTELFANNTTSTHYLDIKAGGYCSEHKHAQKENIFYVVEGELEVVCWGEGAAYSVVLKPGDGYIVPVDTWHLFKTRLGAKCIEIALSNKSENIITCLNGCFNKPLTK